MEQNKIEELTKELTFMYAKYEELCEAYKKLAQSKNPQIVTPVHDMRNMSFAEYDKDKK